jgi:hypothetical protein
MNILFTFIRKIEMKMNLSKKLACSVVTLLFCNPSHAIPTYFTADAVLPNGIGTLASKRNEFHLTASSNATSLALEGFESFANGSPINFGGFTATLINGFNNSFTQVSNNISITTQPISVLSFSTLGSTAVELAFNSVINAFGVDITSIDSTATTISFLDDIGNVLNAFAVGGVNNGGATFFGVFNNQAFSKVRFNFAGQETLNLDQLEYGTAPNVSVSEPYQMVLLAAGITGLVAARRRKRV